MVSRSSLDALSKRAVTLLEHNSLATEEATKHALVLPFIQALGYDVFDPTEVIPEYTADFGLKQGEKVDYAIIREENLAAPAMLIECKKALDPLDVGRASQLSRYFSQTPAHIGILTDGIVYKFFSQYEAYSGHESVFGPIIQPTGCGLCPVSGPQGLFGHDNPITL